MVMEHDKLAKSRGILLSIIEMYQFFWVTTKKLSSNLESLQFTTFSAKCRKFKIGKRDSCGKSRNGCGKVMEKYFVKSVGTLNIVTGDFDIS